MKILIASVSPDGGDGLAVQAQVLIYCPTAITQVVYYNDMSDAVAYAIANGFNGIARNVNDFHISYGQATVAKASGVWISWGHYSNSQHSFEAIPDHLVDYSIGVGKGVGGVNQDSYGPGLDFFVDEEPNESQACGAVAGRIGQILIDNPTFSFDNARYLLRKNSSFFPTFAVDGGYGAVNLGTIPIEKIDYWGTPPVPTSLSGTRSGDGTSVTLSWDAEDTGVTFKVYRSETMDGDFELIASPVTNGYTDTELDANKNYCYKVSAYNAPLNDESAQTPVIISNPNVRLSGYLPIFLLD